MIAITETEGLLEARDGLAPGVRVMLPEGTPLSEVCARVVHGLVKSATVKINGHSITITRDDSMDPTYCPCEMADFEEWCVAR